jgi:hypothetical protein
MEAYEITFLSASVFALRPFVFLCTSPNFLVLWSSHRNRDGVVDIATGYELDNRGVGVRVPVV